MMQIRERNFAFGYFIPRNAKRETSFKSLFNPTAVANILADGINLVHALNVDSPYCRNIMHLYKGTCEKLVVHKDDIPQEVDVLIFCSLYRSI